MLHPNSLRPTEPLAQVRLLGHVAVESVEGSTTVSGRPAVVLAALALQRGPVSKDRLIDLLWDVPPSNPANALQRHISRIRAVLARHGAAGVVLQCAGSYELVRGTISVDVDSLISGATTGAFPPRWWLEPLAGIDHVDFVGHKWRLERLCRRVQGTNHALDEPPTADNLSGPDIPPEVVNELTRWLDLRAAHDETAGVIRTWLESVARPTLATSCQP